MDLSNFLAELTLRDAWMLLTVFFCSLNLFDDVMIDIFSLVLRLRPKKLKESEVKALASRPEKKIAIAVANWKEQDILEHAVNGNIANIEYKNYEIYLGVYPNDKETLAAAERAAAKHPNVKVVVNTKNGPTSKGQMLNEVVRHLVKVNQERPNAPIDVLLIHDAEDVIHRKSLQLINNQTESFDYIQVPVFSLPVSMGKFTAGIYIDEFAESHTKDLLVREHFKGGVPSAGVGTAMTWKALTQVMKKQGGDFLNESTLTEDYHLGLTCNEMGLKCTFTCLYFERKNEKTGEMETEYIATREYFPQKLGQSLRQKSRWTTGISLQGFENLKWRSSGFWGSYFLWRDRKGLMAGPLVVSALIFTAYFIYSWLTTGLWPWLDYAPLNPAFSALMWANLIFSILRIIQRMYLVTKVYNFKTAILVPVRWALSNLVNSASTLTAVFNYTESKVTGKPIAWVKTDHIIPADFGAEKTSTAIAQKTSIGKGNSGPVR